MRALAAAARIRSGEENPLDLIQQSRPKAVGGLTKLSPDAPPQPPLSLLPGGLAGEQREPPLVLAPLLPLADKALLPLGTGSGATFLNRAILERTPGTARRAHPRELTPFKASGGIPRRSAACLRFERSDTANPSGLRKWQLEQAPTAGPLGDQGNFLFDPATPADFRQGLLAAGAAQGKLATFGVRGDRGAQLITEPSHWPPGWAASQIQVRTWRWNWKWCP